VPKPDRISDAQSYFSLLSRTISTLSRNRIDEVAELLFAAYQNNQTVFVFGNGGSASLASHFACDLGKGTCPVASNRKRFRVMALTDNIPTMTAWANDYDYEDIFAEQLKNFIRPRDVAFAISCSGNSPNVLKALRAARAEGAVTIGLGGFEGGKMRSLCDACVVVPSQNMQIIEDLHLSVAHCIFTTVLNNICAVDLERTVAAGVSS
jgi:D-sedoheptulose 7-phosphate isomerase